MATPELRNYVQPFKTDHLGQIFMTGILEVRAFSQVDLEIVQRPRVAATMTAVCDTGKIRGQPLAFPLGTAGQIHTFGVIGPEFSVVLTGGPPDTDIPNTGVGLGSLRADTARSSCRGDDCVSIIRSKEHNDAPLLEHPTRRRRSHPPHR
jgi:hypothetical protein